MFGTISNDNSPDFAGAGDILALESGDAIGLRRLQVEKAYENVAKDPDGSHNKTDKPSFKISNLLTKPASFIASLCIWVFALAATYLALQSSLQAVASILVLAVSGWAALLLAYVCKVQNRAFFRDLGLSGVVGSLMGSMLIAMTSYNLPIDLATLCGGLSLLTIILAALIKERYLLTISCMAALSWTAYSLLNMQTSVFLWAFPVLWIMQMSLAIEFKAKIPLALASLSGLFWMLANIIIIAAAAKISPLMAICALFAAGFTYSRIGKSMQDSGLLGGLFQTNIGWAVAAICALLLQDYWLMSTPHMPWANMSNSSALAYPMTAQWSALLLICTMIIGVASLLRMRKERQTFFGSLGILLFAALLPASIAFKPQLLATASQYGIQVTPSVGLLIGGAVTALALAMLVNGLRRSKPSMMLLALATLSVEAIIVMDSVYAEPDNLTLFGFTVLLMTLTAGLYAHNGQVRENARLAHA